MGRVNLASEAISFKCGPFPQQYSCYSEDYAFNIGVQFYSEIEGRKIFVEKMVLDTPNLKTQKSGAFRT